MVPLFDLHCDTLSKAYDKKLSLFSSSLNISFNKCDIFSPYIQIMAIWTNDALDDFEGFKKYKKVLEFAKNQRITFENDYNFNNFSLILSIEDLRIIGNDLSKIDDLYSDGVRIVTPLWKNTSIIGGAWNTDSGVTKFGISALKRAIELGMIVDVSHASQKSFDDILSLCNDLKSIPIATHSNSFSVCPHKRNLTNKQFTSLVSFGGIVGISLAPEHLSLSDSARISDILRHIDTYLSLGGENFICLGCDLDGIDSLPNEMKDITSLSLLYEQISKFYNETISNKIFFENAHSFFKNYSLNRKKCNTV